MLALIVIALNSVIALCWYLAARDYRVLAAAILCCPVGGLAASCAAVVCRKKVESEAGLFAFADTEGITEIPDVRGGLQVMPISDIGKVDISIGLLVYDMVFEHDANVRHGSHFVSTVKAKRLRVLQEAYLGACNVSDMLAILRKMVKSGIYSKTEEALYRRKFLDVAGGCISSLECQDFEFYIECLVRAREFMEALKLSECRVASENVLKSLIWYAYQEKDVVLMRRLLGRLCSMDVSAEGAGFVEYWKERLCECV